MTRLPKSFVDAAAAHKADPGAFLNAVGQIGTLSGDFWMLDHLAYNRLVRQHPANRGLGDMVSKVATPIARALKLPCVDRATGELRQESGCAKRKAMLNQLGNKIGI
jgi:hypothetical protein